MKKAAIIAAAGIGRRMGPGVPKQYLEILSRPIICHTLDRFRDSGIDYVVIVVESGREDGFRREILERYGYPSSWKVVAGGDVRQRSVYNGLLAVSADADIVLVHDGVRPFVRQDEMDRACEIAFKKGACILASRIKETVKEVGEDGNIKRTVERENLWGARTPQVFRRELLMKAMKKAFDDNFMGTDEAIIVERLGHPVAVIECDDRNIKITTPSDLVLAEAFARGWKQVKL
jgi:2-C-methyl-D-erythritol 4-phosphate cytidylyltransferase